MYISDRQGAISDPAATLAERPPAIDTALVAEPNIIHVCMYIYIYIYIYIHNKYLCTYIYIYIYIYIRYYTSLSLLPEICVPP